LIKLLDRYWVAGASIVFLVINLLFLADNNWFASVAPLVLAVVLMAFISLDKLCLLVVFATPLSVNLSEFFYNYRLDVSLPTEPLLAGILLVFVFKMLSEPDVDKRIFKHPISVAIYIYLAWFLLTSLTSTMIEVSLKQFISRLWFIVGFYFVPAHMFKRENMIVKYLWAYIIAFAIVVAITLYKHSLSHFAYETSYRVMQPFYHDHTSYGAVLGIVVPILFGMRSRLKQFSIMHFVYIAFIGLMLVATLYSYTRATWASLVAALGFWLVAKFRIKARVVILGGITFLAILIPLWTQIIITLESNSETSATDSFVEKAKSITNISNDESNLERLNRWSCAYRMFLKKPVFGWGPGTYMFQYAPFQLSYERTVISTNASNQGNAHSEYLSRLAESGFIGMLLFVVIVGMTIYRSLCLFSYSKQKYVSHWALFIFLSMSTYYMHGFLNNFLDSDKLTALFWGMTAMIVALDVYHNKKEEPLV